VTGVQTCALPILLLIKNKLIIEKYINIDFIDFIDFFLLALCCLTEEKINR
jgi:hypothetical protein